MIDSSQVVSKITMLEQKMAENRERLCIRLQGKGLKTQAIGVIPRIAERDHDTHIGQEVERERLQPSFLTTLIARK